MTIRLLIITLILNVISFPLRAAGLNEDSSIRVARAISSTDCVKSEKDILSVLTEAQPNFLQTASLSPSEQSFFRSFNKLLVEAERVAIECATKHKKGPLFEARMNVVGAYPSVRSWVSTYLKQQPNAPILTSRLYRTKGEQDFDALLSSYKSLVSH